MRYSSLVLAAAGAAMAQELHTTILTIGFTNTAGSAITTVTTYTYDFSNPQTSLLTETNSLGIITGAAATELVTSQPAVVTTQPAVVTTQPAVVTTQPAAAIIPAGLGTGDHTLTLPQSTGTGLTTISFSIGSSTTSFLTPQASTTSPTGTASGAGSGGSGGSGSGTSTATSSSSSSSSTGNAASGFVPASVGLLSLGTLFAALF